MEYTINTIPKTSPAVNGIKENNVFKRGIQTADKRNPIPITIIPIPKILQYAFLFSSLTLSQ